MWSHGRPAGNVSCITTASPDAPSSLPRVKGRMLRCH